MGEPAARSVLPGVLQRKASCIRGCLIGTERESSEVSMMMKAVEGVSDNAVALMSSLRAE